MACLKITAILIALLLASSQIPSEKKWELLPGLLIELEKRFDLNESTSL